MKQPSIFIVCILALLAIPAGITQAESSFSIIHGPYLVQPTDTSVIVTWFTDKNAVSRVDYGAGAKLTMRAIRTSHGLVDANTTSHSIELTGLKPGTRYNYRIFSKEIVLFEPYHVTYGDSVTSGTFSFTTLDKTSSSTTFAIFQDVHQHAVRLDSMLQHINFDTVDLVFFNGDTISHFEQESQIFDGFLDVSVDRFASETPFIFVRGNHETRGLKARELDTYMPLRTGRYFYAFDSGPVHFTILDSGEDKPDTNEEYSGLVAFDPYIDMQTKWLRKEIESEAFKSAKYRIVVVHLPPFGGNNWYREQYLGRAWVPVLNKAGVDIVFCGHTHKFAWMDPGFVANTFPLVTIPPENFTEVTASPSGIAISMKDVTGDEVFQKELKPFAP